MEGRIIKALSGFYYVQSAGGEITQCRARGKFRKDGQSPLVGDMVEFGGLLGAAPIMPIKTGSPAKFIGRGGRIPAPIQSLKN